MIRGRALLGAFVFSSLLLCCYLLTYLPTVLDGGGVRFAASPKVAKVRQSKARQGKVSSHFSCRQQTFLKKTKEPRPFMLPRPLLAADDIHFH